jgi:hypothetical protein
VVRCPAMDCDNVLDEASALHLAFDSSCGVEVSDFIGAGVDVGESTNHPTSESAGASSAVASGAAANFSETLRVACRSARMLSEFALRAVAVEAPMRKLKMSAAAVTLGGAGGGSSAKLIQWCTHPGCDSAAFVYRGGRGKGRGERGGKGKGSGGSGGSGSQKLKAWRQASKANKTAAKAQRLAKFLEKTKTKQGRGKGQTIHDVTSAENESETETDTDTDRSSSSTSSSSSVVARATDVSLPQCALLFCGSCGVARCLGNCGRDIGYQRTTQQRVYSMRYSSVCTACVQCEVCEELTVGQK